MQFFINQFLLVQSKDNFHHSLRTIQIGRAAVRAGATGASAPAKIRQRVRRTRPQDLRTPSSDQKMKNHTLLVALGCRSL